MAPAACRAPMTIRKSAVLSGAVERWTRQAMQSCSHAAMHVWIDQLYALVLPTVARWEAAQFMTLSFDPGARRPPKDGIIDGKMYPLDIER